MSAYKLNVEQDYIVEHPRERCGTWGSVVNQQSKSGGARSQTVSEFYLLIIINYFYLLNINRSFSSAEYHAVEPMCDIYTQTTGSLRPFMLKAPGGNVFF